jgi:hypothetical protein
MRLELLLLLMGATGDGRGHPRHIFGHAAHTCSAVGPPSFFGFIVLIFKPKIDKKCEKKHT